MLLTRHVCCRRLLHARVVPVHVGSPARAPKSEAACKWQEEKAGGTNL